MVHTVLDENKSSQREHTVCAHYMAWEHGANNRKSFISLINLLSFSNMTSDEKWSIDIYIYIQYLFSRENRYRPETLRTQFILFGLDITLLTSFSQDMFVRRLLLRIVHSVSTYSI